MRTRVTPSGGSVFADLGIPNPDEQLFKSTLLVKGAPIDRGLPSREKLNARPQALSRVDLAPK